ncbi:hypothetical protein [Pedobacter agri]|nr:hypothetical protein [Pedobacter agri]
MKYKLISFRQLKLTAKNAMQEKRMTDDAPSISLPSTSVDG